MSVQIARQILRHRNHPTLCLFHAHAEHQLLESHRLGAEMAAALAYRGQLMLLFLPMAKKETKFVYSFQTWKDFIDNATQLSNSRPPAISPSTAVGEQQP